ncbi:hypothetical protein, partial [Nitratireductor aquibiodomus]|uniref:hypothetical protein n=1 Tax=Nitratireductor aquibiodomus TaxID=204799 RepID=UPI001FCABD49
MPETNETGNGISVFRLDGEHAVAIERPCAMDEKRSMPGASFGRPGVSCAFLTAQKAALGGKV